MKPERLSSKTLSYRIWIAAGFLMCAVVLKFVIVPLASKLPYTFSRSIEAEGEVRLFDQIELDAQRFPVNAFLSITGSGGYDDRTRVQQKLTLETPLSETSFVAREAMELLLEYANIKQVYWEKIKLVFGNTVESEFWVDVDSATYITPEAAQGKHFLFPVGATSQETYDFYDNSTKSSLTFNHTDDETIEGLPTKQYTADIGAFNLGSFSIPKVGTRVRLDARGDLTVWVEKESGMIVRFDLDLALVAKAGILDIDVMSIDFDPTSEQGAAFLQEGKKIRRMFLWGKVWGPLLVTVGAVILLYSAIRKPVSSRSVRSKINYRT
ncbi:MAG TPA: porin PorA family protein [bacterium]|nr:porin PorA family protein [bacterium]